MALKAAPGDAALEETLAKALLNLGDYDEADALFVKLRKASPDKLNLTLKHADLMRRRNKGKDVSNGTKLLEDLAKKDKFNEDILANLVVFYRLQGKDKKAEKTIRRLLSRHPDSVAAYMNLSMIYFAKAQTAKKSRSRCWRELRASRLWCLTSSRPPSSSPPRSTRRCTITSG